MSSPGDFRPYVCRAVKDETADVRSFTFGPREGGAAAAPRPGQAVTLAMNAAGVRLVRTFSVSDARPSDGTVTITVKAHPRAGATAWMHRELTPGTTVDLKGPHGTFTLPERLPERLALVSAGSGAAPLMAMLRSVEALAPASDVAWMHLARTPDDILFRDELACLQGRMPTLGVSVALSGARPGWFGYRGRVTRRMMASAIPDFGRREVFCCGPEGFMDTVRLIHAAEGGRAEAFNVERFGAVAPRAVVAGEAAGAEGPSFQATFGHKTFSVRPNETILAAASRQVVVIPCGCGTGLCGTCRIRLVEGRVEMHHQGGVTPEEEAEGYVLACSARPLTDVVLAP